MRHRGLPSSALRLLAIICCVTMLAAVPVSHAGVIATRVNGASGDQWGPIANTYFGMHIHHLDVPYPTGKSAWPFVAFGSWRLQGAYVSWLDLEPTKGGWDFRRMDRYVEQARTNGVDVVLTLGKTPAWASARPAERCNGCAAEPASTADWENYVRTLVRRYKGRIKYYEVWNEPRFHEMEGRLPDGSVGYFSGSVAALVELAKVAKAVLAEEDSEAKLISPSFVSGDLGIRRLKLFLSAGGGKYMDVLGFHFYADVPEKIAGMGLKLGSLLHDSHLEGVPIWNTESGFTYERPGHSILPERRTGSYLDVLPVQLGAAYVSRALVIAAASGVARFYWFNWDGEPPHPTMGIAWLRGTFATPMTRAYQRTRAWLLGNSISPCETGSADLWLCHVQDKAGRNSWVAWRANGEGPADLSRLGKGLTVERLLSDSADLNVDLTNIVIGAAPILIRQ